ncbi:hypothetical protein ARHIZOSPH14_13400 [Agromyces rhizosphaerae]|uniref:DUF3618 domain-containing protein n=1 Tax=Agromyces rhizosphaerae TaxID=88374 RepID=A0A9W6D091_9MICO|nr:DUF3618 domain-containing protein [Agromyces rhizosphaerae]GLI27098.1 hypothetical protein ARHIZOSPH14_13400 [Agromyces rhizosphaerae]
MSAETRDAAKAKRNLSRVEARAEAAVARADLAATLDLLEDKLNVPKQAALAKERAMARFRRMRSDSPGTLIGIGIGAVAVVAAGVLLVVRALGDDD